MLRQAFHFNKITSNFKLNKYVQISLKSMANSSTTSVSNNDSVIFEERGNKGVIILNRPKVLNSLNIEMIQNIYSRLKMWESNKSLVIIKGAGEKAFCAGGDVVSIIKDIKNGGILGLSKEFFKKEYKLNCLIGTYHIPYIAFISEITMGGGVGLSVHGQFRIATEKSLFSMPETSLGLFPDVGGSYFLPRLGGNLGTYLALTGHRLKGRDLLKAGIATHVCDHAKLADLEKSILTLESPYQEDINTLIQKFSDLSTFNIESEFSLKPVMPNIKKCFQGKTVEEIISNLEEDGSEWAQTQIKILNKCSPTSLKITLEQLRRGEHLTLQECLSMENRLAQRCCTDNDFVEGVRALLIDKDNSPKWNPDRLSLVTDEKIEYYFSPLPKEDELQF